MDRALWLLLQLRFKGWRRRWIRKVQTLKGTLLALVGSLLFLPVLIVAFVAPSMGHAEHLAMVRRFGPLMLFGYCVLNVLLSSGDHALYFNPAEIDFLFTGPFRRRQLLLFRVISNLGAIAVSAVFMTMVLGYHAARTLSAFVALFLALELLYLFALVIGLAGSTIGALAYNRRRQWGLIVFAGVLIAALAPLGNQALRLEPWELIQVIERSPAVRTLLIPFQPYILAFTSEHLWPDLVQWSALSLAIDLALIGVVLAIDARYYEISAAVSVRIYARVRKARRGIVASSPSKAHFSLPMLPWGGGVGPNVWRQSTTALRQPARLVALMVLFVFPILSIYFSVRTAARAGAEINAANIGLPMIIGMALFAPSMVAFDFRTDVDRMEELKTLPIHPRRLVVGQIVTPALILTLSQWVAAAFISAVTRPNLTLLSGFIVLIVPFNLLMVEIENLFFLWYPVPNVPGVSVDFQTIGRQMLLMLAKLACAGMVAALAAGAGALAFYASGDNWTAALATAWLIMAIACWALVPVIAQAFTQFDVASDAPA